MRKRARDPSSVEPDVIKHIGVLTQSSLDRCLPRYLFTPATKHLSEAEAKADPFHMGWEHVRFSNQHRFELDQISFATADGVATLAAVCECLRAKPGSHVELHTAENSTKWSDALGLRRIASGDWDENDSPAPSNPSGCYAFPISRFVLTCANDCASRAGQIAERVASLWQMLRRDDSDEVSSAVRSVAYEALLNVLEHAYQGNQIAVAFNSITVSPVPISYSRPVHAEGDVEHAWFNCLLGQGMMLEVAIGDYGAGVPSTLWRSYRSQHPTAFDQMAKLSLGSQRGQIERAKLHQAISVWAFHHKSTRKNDTDFPSRLAYLNWRGLHRAMNTVATFSGCLVMRTGVARIGYAFYEGNSQLIRSAETERRHEFPGTGIVFRLPLWKDERRSKRAVLDSSISGKRIRIGRAISVTDPLPEATEAPPIHCAFRAVVHPFSELTTQDLPGLLERQLSVSPKNIEIHMFMRTESGHLLQDLQAFDPKSPLEHTGPPGLMAVAEPTGRLSWKFVGLIPESVRSVVSSLEATGSTRIDEAETHREFANSLVRLYKPVLTIEEGRLRLAGFNSILSVDDFEVALQRAFEIWARRTDEPWLLDKPDRVIRLPTGRLVRKYVSVLKLLHSNAFLEEAVGYLLMSLIGSLEKQYPELRLVTDSEASAYIARILLRRYPHKIEPHVGVPKDAEHLHNVVVFVDAVEKGQTLKSLASQIPNCRLIISCVDLRKRPVLGQSFLPIPFRSLLQFPFDPQDIDEDSLRGEMILEVDSVTHIAAEKTPAEDFPIGTNDEREEFLPSIGHAFRYGLHRSGGRTHVVSLSAADLLRSHRDTVAGWISERIISALENAVSQNAGEIDVVVFCRREASAKDLVPELGRRLTKSSTCLKAVYRVFLPALPSGPGELYGRPTAELLDDIRNVDSVQLSFVEHPARFLAVYLDDACVTGKTLLDFLVRVSVAKVEQLPVAVLAIPIVSRFSPAEERFVTLVVRQIGTVHTSTSRIPFWFTPLFRLQVRSFARLESTPVFPLASELISHASKLDMRIRNYAARVERGLSPFRAAIPTENQAAFVHAHIFYGGPAGKSLVVSTTAVRIRHLIALLEQNVAVLSRLLRETKSACEQGDYSLLTVLALEPRLLQSPPLEKESWSLITDLAIRCLHAPVDKRIKSDALCVLFQQGATIIDRLRDVLLPVAEAPELVDQFLAMLLTGKDLHGSLAQVLVDLDKLANLLHPEGYEILRSTLKGHESVAALKQPTVKRDAEMAVSRLLAQTSYHAEGWMSLNALQDWRESEERARVSKRAHTMRRMVEQATLVCKEVVLPGLLAIQWLAESQGNTGSLRDLEQAAYDLSSSVEKLDLCVKGLEPRVIGRRNAEKIGALWETVQQSSISRSCNKFLAEPVRRTNNPLPILERWLPEFFCLPFEAVTVLASEMAQPPRITTSWEDLGTRKVIVAAPYPLQQVHRIIQLLLTDMRKHGEPRSLDIKLTLAQGGFATNLSAEFRDKVRKFDTHGGGGSQEQAARIASEIGLPPLEFDDPGQAGSQYRVRVIFPDILFIRLG